MALLKALPIGNGFDATYHCIATIFIDRNANETTIRIDSYKDEAAFQADASARAAERTRTFAGTPPAPCDDLIAWCYDQIPQDDADFASATLDPASDANPNLAIKPEPPIMSPPA